MKRLLQGFAGFALLATLAASTAHAQNNLMTVGAFGGVVIPSGSTSDALKAGWGAGAVFQFKPAGSPVGFQIDGMYSQLKASDSAKVLNPAADKGEIWDATGNVVFWFPVAAETKIHPYILGGGGVYNLKSKFTDGTSTSETKFGINAGAGFDFDFQSNAAFFVEGRFHNVFVTGSDTKLIPITAGFRFKT